VAFFFHDASFFFLYSNGMETPKKTC